MDLLHPQLAAFAAILEEGSFEAAAQRLSVTSSAISQRIAPARLRVFAADLIGYAKAAPRG